ncbi:MAG TPA: DUF5069 domain-containing protein [Candidatus Cybelea sp.]|jgi:hypothetical protein|nr:DUF5069 domain-containing protein [Candidatus Cybelea sp.]
MPIQAPDLTQRPPRSPRVRLGGFATLPRMLDKGRATIAGQSGEYQYNCPLDQRLLSFLGLDADKLKAQLAEGKGDGEILEWIEANTQHRHSLEAIAAWSQFQEQRTAADVESRQFLQDYQTKMAPRRKDISTWFDMLDVDDHVTFGGKA